MSSSSQPIPSFGALMREWRDRRHLSQLALALKSGISQRHLSFVESGRSDPSREMVLRLAEHLDVPLRERNSLLLAAGFAPVFRERPLSDAALSAARSAIARLLHAHEPYPAITVDRYWNLLEGNQAMVRLTGDVLAAWMPGPVNVLSLSLHPDGLAPRIVNLRQWREHLFARLQRQIDVSGDPRLEALLAELREYPVPLERRSASTQPADDADSVIVPLQLRAADGGVLSFISTTTVFGTPTEVTLSEIALESFFPADAETAERLREMAS